MAAAARRADRHACVYLSTQEREISITGAVGRSHGHRDWGLIDVLAATAYYLSHDHSQFAAGTVLHHFILNKSPSQQGGNVNLPRMLIFEAVAIKRRSLLVSPWRQQGHH